MKKISGLAKFEFVVAVLLFLYAFVNKTGILNSIFFGIVGVVFLSNAISKLSDKK
ncbi:hypothetical protein [Romboutsia sp.]|uniref:hypothetical protein n=1 Tax=Romboutsia sp. TaxID=1965302 RepID=UPI003F398662